MGPQRERLTETAANDAYLAFFEQGDPGRVYKPAQGSYYQCRIIFEPLRQRGAR